jgi:hypothetical protein
VFIFPLKFVPIYVCAFPLTCEHKMVHLNEEEFEAASNWEGEGAWELYTENANGKNGTQYW